MKFSAPSSARTYLSPFFSLSLPLSRYRSLFLFLFPFHSFLLPSSPSFSLFRSCVFSCHPSLSLISIYVAHATTELFACILSPTLSCTPCISRVHHRHFFPMQNRRPSPVLRLLSRVSSSLGAPALGRLSSREYSYTAGIKRWHISDLLPPARTPARRVFPAPLLRLVSFFSGLRYYRTRYYTRFSVLIRVLAHAVSHGPPFRESSRCRRVFSPSGSITRVSGLNDRLNIRE